MFATLIHKICYDQIKFNYIERTSTRTNSIKIYFKLVFRMEIIKDQGIDQITDKGINQI